MSIGTRALLLVAGSAATGAVYVLYLTVEPFPPDVVRLVPEVWLAGSLLGGALAARALTTTGDRLAAGLALVLDVPSALFAAMFSMAALMGD